MKSRTLTFGMTYSVEGDLNKQRQVPPRGICKVKNDMT